MYKNRKYSLLLGRILLILVSLEIGLRIFEYAYHQYYSRNLFSTEAINENAYRILCVGESTVAGAPYSDPKISFPAQLQILLNREFEDKKIQVINMGVPAVSPSQILNNMEPMLDRFRPGLVILQAGANGDLKKIKDIKIIRLFRAILLYLKYGIHADRNADRSTLKYSYIEERNGIPFSIYRDEITDKRYSRNMKTVKKAIQTVQDRGIPVIICNYFVDNSNKHINSLARQLDIPLCDNQQIYDNSDNKRRLLSYDKWHPSKKGYRIIAKNLFDTIMANGFINVRH